MVIDHEILRTSEQLVSIEYYEKNSTNEGYGLHWHEQIEIYYIITGGIHVLCNGRSQWISNDDIALINWCEPHQSLTFLDGTTHYIIHVDTAQFSSFTNSIYPNFIKRTKTLSSIMNDIIDEYHRKQLGHEYIIMGSLMRLLGHLCRLGSQHNVTNYRKDNLIIIRNILQYLHDNFTTHISLADISNHFGISTGYMCRLFREHTGLTINNYLNKLRFNKAISLISKGFSVTEVSEMVGFHDYNYFSRAFKKNMGFTPSESRKEDSTDRIILP